MKAGREKRNVLFLRAMRVREGEHAGRNFDSKVYPEMVDT